MKNDGTTVAGGNSHQSMTLCFIVLKSHGCEKLYYIFNIYKSHKIEKLTTKLISIQILKYKNYNN